MKSNRWNTHTTKIFIATYSAAFILIAATAILKINLIKIMLTLSYVFFSWVFFFVGMFSRDAPPQGTIPLFDFLERMAVTLSYLNFNEAIVACLVPLIILFIGTIYAKGRRKLSQQ